MLEKHEGFCEFIFIIVNHSIILCHLSLSILVLLITQELIPETLSICVTNGPAAQNTMTSTEFQELKSRFAREFNIALLVYAPPSIPDSSNSNIGSEDIAINSHHQPDFHFILQYHRGNPMMENAKHQLMELLKVEKVPVQYSEIQKTSSYANLPHQVSYDSFQHFNSKLIAPVSSGK